VYFLVVDKSHALLCAITIGDKRTGPFDYFATDTLRSKNAQLSCYQLTKFRNMTLLIMGLGVVFSKLLM
jgi:hypothetical protein